MSDEDFKHHLAEWERLRSNMETRESEPPAAGEGGVGPPGDYHG